MNTRHSATDCQCPSTLYRLGKLVTASLDLHTTLAAIVQAAHELTNADTSAIVLLHEDESLLIRVA